jgi:hypothetical protein
LKRIINFKKKLGLEGVSVGLKDCSVRLYSKKIIRNGNNNNNNDKKAWILSSKQADKETVLKLKVDFK